METKVDILEQKECEKILKIEVPVDRVLVEFENMYSNLQKVAEIPGFRTGKAPMNIVERYFKNKVEKEVFEKLVADAYKEAVKVTNINPIASPNITELKFEPGKPLEFKATVEVKPIIKLNKYKGIKVKKESTDIKTEEVEKSLKFLQEKYAEFIPVEKRSIKDKDFVIVDFVGLIEGQEVKDLKEENYVFEIGSNKIIPEIEKGVMGANINEQKEIVVEYKPDFVNKELAGKKVTYKVLVKGIKEKRLPNLDDEFAKDVGEFKTLNDLKKEIEKGLKIELEHKEKIRITNLILDGIIKITPFSVPKSLVTQESERLLNDFEARMQSQNITYESSGKSEEETKKQCEEIAVKRVEGYLVLEEIAKLEKMSISDEEVDKEISEFLSKAGQEKERWKEYLNSTSGRENVRGQLLQDKVLDFLYNEAEIT
ncbi:MAG: trigger factor [Candidatus Firestonebacteria bacterium]